MMEVGTSAARTEQRTLLAKHSCAWHMHANKHIGHLVWGAAVRRRKKGVQDRTAISHKSAATRSAAATAQQSRLAIDEGSRLAGGKVKVIGELRHLIPIPALLDSRCIVKQGVIIEHLKECRFGAKRVQRSGAVAQKRVDCC